MSEPERACPADQRRTERRARFTVARAVLLGALSFGSLIGGAAAASADPIIGGYTATCEYSSNAGTARPIVAATEGVGDTEQEALDNARGLVPGKPLSVNCFLTEEDQPNVASAFNAARGQDGDDDDDSTTGGSYHQRHNNPGR